MRHEKNIEGKWIQQSVCDLSVIQQQEGTIISSSENVITSLTCTLEPAN